MSDERKNFTLLSPRIRANAAEALRKAGDGYRVTIAPPQRSTDQNAKLHAMLTDIAASGFQWAGKRRTTDEWKAIMVSAHAVATSTDPERSTAEVITGLEGEVVQLRESTAGMSVTRASSLIEYVQAWCDGAGIKLTETRKGGWLDERRAA